MRLSDKDWVKIHQFPIEAVFMFKDRIANSIDTAVKEKKIKNPGEAKVTIHGNVNDEDFWYLHEYDIDVSAGFSIAELFKVAEVHLVDGTEYVEEGKLKLEIEKTQLQRCPRCRRYLTNIGTVKEWSEVCIRCSEVLEQMYKQWKDLNKSKELWEARQAHDQVQSEKQHKNNNS